jgi:hypothetical protein
VPPVTLTTGGRSRDRDAGRRLLGVVVEAAA